MKSMSIPFRLDGYGKVATSERIERVWANRVKSVMGTPQGQRVMNPDFGSSIPNGLMSAAVPGLIETSVQAAAAQWLPDITIQGVRISDSTDLDGELNVEVVYEVPSSQFDQQSYSVRII
jgi:uncharacterized protein